MCHVVTLMIPDNQFQRERNNGKIIRACDTEATPGGGVQYHKCYDQDGEYILGGDEMNHWYVRDGNDTEQKLRKSKRYFQVCQNADFLPRHRTTATTNGLGMEAGFQKKTKHVFSLNQILINSVFPPPRFLLSTGS